MKKQAFIIGSLALVLIGLTLLRNPQGSVGGSGENQPQITEKNTEKDESTHSGLLATAKRLWAHAERVLGLHTGSVETPITTTENSSEKSSEKQIERTAGVTEKVSDECYRVAYQHQPKNKNRDIEEFLNDTNAFPIPNSDVSEKSVCVKVNNKPVSFKYVKKSGKAEVIVGSVVGPDSTIQVSYCTGKMQCKESCVVSTKNKVDELLSETDIAGVENAALEAKVKELRSIASANAGLLDSTVIRDWNEIQKKSWVCR